MSKNFQKKAWIYKRQGILGLGIPRGPDFSPPFGGDLPSINPTKPMKTASNSYVKCFLESPDGGKSCESLKKKGRVAVIHFCKLLSSKQVLETYQKKFSTNILSPQKFQQLPFLHQFHHRPHNTTCSEKKYIKSSFFRSDVWSKFAMQLWGFAPSQTPPLGGFKSPRPTLIQPALARGPRAHWSLNGQLVMFIFLYDFFRNLPSRAPGLRFVRTN